MRFLKQKPYPKLKTGFICGVLVTSRLFPTIDFLPYQLPSVRQLEGQRGKTLYIYNMFIRTYMRYVVLRITRVPKGF